MNKREQQYIKMKFFEEVNLKMFIIKLLIAFSFLIAATNWVDFVNASILTILIILSMFVLMLSLLTRKEMRIYKDILTEIKINAEK